MELYRPERRNTTICLKRDQRRGDVIALAIGAVRRDARASAASGPRASPSLSSALAAADVGFFRRSADLSGRVGPTERMVWAVDSRHNRALAPQSVRTRRSIRPSNSRRCRRASAWNSGSELERAHHPGHRLRGSPVPDGARQQRRQMEFSGGCRRQFIPVWRNAVGVVAPPRTRPRPSAASGGAAARTVTPCFLHLPSPRGRHSARRKPDSR